MNQSTFEQAGKYVDISAVVGLDKLNAIVRDNSYIDSKGHMVSIYDVLTIMAIAEIPITANVLDQLASAHAVVKNEIKTQKFIAEQREELEEELEISEAIEAPKVTPPSKAFKTIGSDRPTQIVYVAEPNYTMIIVCITIAVCMVVCVIIHISTQSNVSIPLLSDETFQTAYAPIVATVDVPFSEKSNSFANAMAIARNGMHS